MELYQLRTFACVAEEGHLTRAAKRLHASQSTISGHIKALEAELGVALFTRTPKGMTLSTDGEALLAETRKILRATQSMANTAAALREDVTGRAHVGLNTNPGILRSTAFLSAMTERYPKVEVHLRQLLSGEILQGVKDDDLDAGFFCRDNPYPEVASLRLGKFNVLLAAPVEWNDKVIGASMEELAKLPWIWAPAESPCHRVAQESFDAHGITPCKAVVADDESLFRTLVAAGKGLCFMVEQDALEGREKGELIIWDGPPMCLNLYLAYRKDRADSRLVRAVTDTVRSVWELAPE